MNIDLSKTSGKKPPGKVVELDLEENFKKPVTCAQCGSENYTGFSTDFGLFRRCTKCRYEWPTGGIPGLASISKEEKELLVEYQNNMMQDEAYNRALSLAEDMERLDDVRTSERLSGSSVNRSFWNDYIRQWDEEGEY